MFGAAIVLPDLVARRRRVGDRASAQPIHATRSSTAAATTSTPSMRPAPPSCRSSRRSSRPRPASRGARRSRSTEARLLRLLPGDYLLAHHDRILEGNPVEVTADLSPASVPGAEVHYRRRGQVYFRFPCVPGSVAVVERGPTVTCNHTYVSKLHAGASVVRLVVLLR